MHFRLEVGRCWLQVGRSDPDQPESDPGPPHDTPQPMTVYAERTYPLGFDMNLSDRRSASLQPQNTRMKENDHVDR